MNEERDLKEIYCAAQNKITAPKKAVESTRQALDDDEAVAAARNANASNGTKQTRRATFGPCKRAPFYAAAACLALAALGFGAVQVTGNANDGSGDPSANGGIVNAASLDFAVKAYASGTQTPLAAGDNGMVVFGRASDTALATAEYGTNGSYTGCLFRVEAEGVKTVQAHISKGMLYRYDVRNATYANDEGLLTEAASWKPTKRGLGEQLSKYDMVSTAIMSDGLAKDDPNKTYQVQTSKRLGQTAQLNYDEGDTQAYFGLWTDEPIGDASQNADEKEVDKEYDAIANTFEGAELTITVTFEDGRTSTQVIELHAGNFAAQWNAEDADGLATLDVTPVLLDDSSDVPEDEFAVRTVYGEVVSSSNEAFPYASEPANEFADIVDDPMPLPTNGDADFQETGQIVDVTNDGKPFTTYANADTGNPNEDAYSARENSASLEISNVSIGQQSSLPEGTQLQHTEIARMESLEYWNRIVQQRCGFSLSESFAPSEGASIIGASFEITNASGDEKVLRIPNAFGIGKIESDGTFHESANAACALMYEATKGDGTVLGWLDNDMLTLAPGETATVKAFWEVNDAAFENADAAIAFGANDERNAAVRFAMH